MINPLPFRRPQFVRPFLFVLALGLVPVTLHAEPVGVNLTDLSDPAPVTITARDGMLELSLEDAIAISLRRNLALQVQRYARRQSLLGIEENLGMYDFNLSSFLRLRSETSPPVSTLVQTGGAAETTKDRFGQIELDRLTPWGGTATAHLDTFRQESNDLADFINPLYATNFDLTFTQPLMRNFGRIVTERNLIKARTNVAINREDFEAQVNVVLQDVIDRYWELVEAREQLRVARESLTLAEELHEMNRIQVEVGTKAPLEMVTSEATVATRQEDIIARTAAMEDVEDRLRRLLNLDQGALWSVPILPTTDAEQALDEPDVEAAIAKAIERRTDIRRKKLELENLGVDATFARNQIKPQLDALATYGFNGIGGTINIVDRETGQRIDTISGGYGDALEQLTETDFDGWTFSLTFSFPLQNRAAKARKASAELAVERGQAELRDLVQDVITQVRRSARAVRTASQQITSARVSRNLEQKNLDAEQKRYENGLSTSFQVLEIQEDLAQALSREVAAVTNYRRSLAALYNATGELTERFGVELVTGEDL